MNIDMSFVKMVNEANETNKRKANAIKYSKSCKRKEIKYYIALILIILGIGFVGTSELNATPEMQREIQAKETENFYPKTGIVTTVASEFIVFTDFNSHNWKVDMAPEDWDCGDICSAIMDSKGTELIEDDEVIKIQYGGWIY